MKKILACPAIAVLLAGCLSEPINGTSSSAGDSSWTQWGYSSSKNMAAEAQNIPAEFDPSPANMKNILWVAKLGSQTYGNPTVLNDRLFIGTNNQKRGDPRFKGDYSLLKCLDVATGDVIWTLTVPKLGSGKVGDWEFLGICSSPTVVGNRVYIVTNRCEVMALDVNGLADGNQGLQDEGQYMAHRGTTPLPPVDVKKTDADIIWRYDMRKELGVYPHNITSSSILVVGDILYCSTSNGVTYDHTDIPVPKAPALIALDRKLAEDPNADPAKILVGEEGSGLSTRILHGNWTSPCWGEVGGKGILLYGGPDGLCYGFDPTPVKDEDGFGVFPELWRFDCNPATYRFKDGDRSRPIKYATPEGPSEVIATPVFYKGRLYTGIGQDPEHGEGAGNFSCIDAATGRKVWDYRINRTLSTCSIADDLVYVADHSGFLYCFDANDGTLYWKYDTLSLIWASTLVTDGKVFIGNEDGDMTVVDTARMKALADELGAPLFVESEKEGLVVTRPNDTTKIITGDERKKYVNVASFGKPIYLSPIVADGVLYIGTMTHLYAIKPNH